MYNLAGDFNTVISCLARALGNSIALPNTDEEARNIERTAGEILRHYERMNRATGKERDAVVKLLKVREAMEAKDAGQAELCLEVGRSSIVSHLRPEPDWEFSTDYGID